MAKLYPWDTTYRNITFCHNNNRKKLWFFSVLLQETDILFWPYCILVYSAATAPYLGRGVSSPCCPSWPWTLSSSSGQRNKRSNCKHLMDHWKSKTVPEKHLFLLYGLCQSLDCVDHKKLENPESDGNTRPPDLPLEKSVCRSESNWTWNNRLVSNRKRSTSRLYTVTLLI